MGQKTTFACLGCFPGELISMDGVCDKLQEFFGGENPPLGNKITKHLPPHVRRKGRTGEEGIRGLVTAGRSFRLSVETFPNEDAELIATVDGIDLTPEENQRIQHFLEEHFGARKITLPR